MAREGKRPARIAVRMPAVVTTSDDHRFDATVEDLSAEGLRLHLPAGEELLVGETVTLLVGKDRYVAQVRWTAGREAGATFRTAET